jgi:uncharacterized integral membrane protein
MTSPYKRRKPALLKNLWVYRNVILAAALLGVLVWFCWVNGAAVTVVLPFGLGRIESSLGIVILLSGLMGSLLTLLVVGVVLAIRRLRSPGEIADEEGGGQDLTDERPPADYASKTKEGFSEANWSKEL